MDLLLIAALLLVGLILLVAEVYLFSGLSIAGICRKVRELNLPEVPSDRTIYRVVRRLIADYS